MIPHRYTQSAQNAAPTGLEPQSARQPQDEPAGRTTGCGHLTKRSNLATSRARQELPSEVLIIDDRAVDAERLTATLHVLFGYQVPIRWACSLADALDNLCQKMPALAFLGDMRNPPAEALLTIPKLRHAGFDGSIIVVSGTVTPAHRTRLIAAGASDVIHKDEVDSVRVAEALDRARVANRAKRES
ncbi:MAG: response regulator [Hyphomicrobium sp.]|uniref:response regulator n=1 Tax=Hyphomicrobium sp. TaxID=82 RepID=UPI00132316DF|nr:response regulator [Hyphomicrobium sp.]KAB2942496.1 MAG: response regulator [Hyphomicrobium sp.]MBZ0208460.1 response regulator [Hyphomicrobium sp.]MCZ7594644.1 response regulator [Hyphomicrobium sp.]